MNKSTTPYKIFELMFNNDPFSKLLKMNLVHIDYGQCELSLVVTQDMLNGFSIAHGGISYALCDSALAFAANSYGEQCVSAETSISHVRPVKAGETIVASVTEKHKGNRIRIYEVVVKSEAGKTIALFKGIMYNTGKKWEIPGA